MLARLGASTSLLAMLACRSAASAPSVAPVPDVAPPPAPVASASATKAEPIAEPIVEPPTESAPSAEAQPIEPPPAVQAPPTEPALGGFGIVGTGGRGGRRTVARRDPVFTDESYKDMVRRIVRHHLDEVRSCYVAGRERNAELHGRLVVRFTIAPSGRVSSASIEERELPDDAVAQCVVDVVATLTFPKTVSGGDVAVVYPFVLEPD